MENDLWMQHLSFTALLYTIMCINDHSKHVKIESSFYIWLLIYYIHNFSDFGSPRIYRDQLLTLEVGNRRNEIASMNKTTFHFDKVEISNITSIQNVIEDDRR